MAIPSRFVGSWRIIWMELWAEEHVHLDGPALLELQSDGQGRMNFIAVQAWLDAEPSADADRLEFSWEGEDEGDPRSGRGWITLGENTDHLEGYFKFHMGDGSAFKAQRSLQVTARRGRGKARGS
jgi:hypothetical protein